jgi:VIT1/CCC1 family predicted Fe2+/Mn2+ transporter
MWATLILILAGVLLLVAGFFTGRLAGEVIVRRRTR